MRLKPQLLAFIILLAAVPQVFAEELNYKKLLAQPADEQQQDEYAMKEGQTGFWVVGAGAAVNQLPLSASEYTLPLVYFAYESINKRSIGGLDFSWSFGFYDLMPELEFAVFIPAKPLDFRISAGAYYDLIIGGSGGMLVKAGAIINKYVQFDIFMIPIADQPRVSYANSLRQQKIVLRQPGETALVFPIFGVLLGFRF